MCACNNDEQDLPTYSESEDGLNKEYTTTVKYGDLPLQYYPCLLALSFYWQLGVSLMNLLEKNTIQKGGNYVIEMFQIYSLHSAIYKVVSPQMNH